MTDKNFERNPIIGEDIFAASQDLRTLAIVASVLFDDRPKNKVIAGNYHEVHTLAAEHKIDLTEFDGAFALAAHKMGEEILAIELGLGIANG